jgi:hypothetical protein
MNGKPMHSWRVLVLPYLGAGEAALYGKYNFSEPWNGPNNSKLASQMPDVFRCPTQRSLAGSVPTETHYFAIVGAEAAFLDEKSRKISQFRDGTANTIVLVEATGSASIGWSLAT